jgi:hypothetical protein
MQVGKIHTGSSESAFEDTELVSIINVGISLTWSERAVERNCEQQFDNGKHLHGTTIAVLHSPEHSAGQLHVRITRGQKMRVYFFLPLLMVVAAVGCNRSPEGGTPGTSSSFSIGAPTGSTTIKQDNKQSVTLTLHRGSDFKKAVKLTATQPDKVKAEFSKDTIAASDPEDVTLTISVGKDAPLGDQTIHVTATPDGGAATSVDVKIKVEKNP